jgi:hypothetical protein
MMALPELQGFTMRQFHYCKTDNQETSALSFNAIASVIAVV